MKRIFNRNTLNNSVALLSGAAMAFAFAPHHWWLLAFLCPLILLFTLTQEFKPLHLVTGKIGALRGFLFGLGFFGVGASWIFVSIHVFGNTNIFFASIITFIFLLIVASFYSLLGYCLCEFFSGPTMLWLSFPSLAVLSEAALGKFFTGFPWLFLGYSQTVTPLKSYAPLVGVYGVSFLVFLTSALIFMIITEELIYKIFCSILLILVFIGAGLFHDIAWVHHEGEPIHVALIQGNIPQQIKWSDNYAQQIVTTYVTMSTDYWRDYDVIFWPEGAIPVPLPYSLPLTSNLNNFAIANNATLITGIPTQTPAANSYFNSMLALGKNPGIYHKTLLVPFGEFVPLAKYLRGIISFFDLPMSMMVPGPKSQPPMIFGKDKVGTFICYEICYPDRVLNSLVKKDAFLAVISDDAWFGKSWAAQQHAQIAQFAAQATQRYLILSSNNGVTAIVDPYGTFISSLPQFQSGVLTGVILPSYGMTPWGEFGNNSFLILLVIFLFLAKTISGIDKISRGIKKIK